MNEAVVQTILKRWFEKKGFKTIEDIQVNSGNNVDLLAKQGNEKWIIEVKGDYDKNSAQYNVNFDTAMGQILKSIIKLDDETKYCICIPFSKTENGEKLSYRLILKKYSKSLVFEMLHIHIILVRDDESVEVIHPNEVRNFFGLISSEIKREVGI